MPKYLTILCIVIALTFAKNSHAEVVLVTNNSDSGAGSLRDAFSTVASNDTLLIDIKGTITLESQINISSKENITIIGPYPKHITITSAPGFSGNLLNFVSCTNITMRGIGFVGGNGNTRHIRISECLSGMMIDQCLFEGNTVLANGAAAEVSNSNASFTKCSFINNTADIGGAVCATSTAFVIIENCTFSGNRGTTKSGAMDVANGSDVTVRYSSFFNNTAATTPQVIATSIGTTISFENAAIANNGGTFDKQLEMEGSVISYGGNCIKLNIFTETTDMPPAELGDNTSSVMTTGLRASIKTDGFGLKYWPIINSSSDFINRKPATISTPDYDCRNAPRSLGGGGLNFYPDAGACEYTHLRVTNTSGAAGVANSLAWALSPAQRIDLIHYVEFDISGTPGPISFDLEQIISEKSYIIDGFSQSASAIPGPTTGGAAGLTSAILPISLLNASDIGYGLRVESGAEYSIIQGLRIQNFEASGIFTSTTDVSVFGCEIGIDAVGIENGNLKSGIRITSNNNIIGGVEHYNRNVISGNGFGVDIEQSNISIDGGNFNIISGNIIGGNADGISIIDAVDKTLNGVILSGSNNIIGLKNLNGKNIIIDNQNGILGAESTSENTIQNNYIGMGWDALSEFGNTNAGIFFQGSDNNQIGGYHTYNSNLIANNEVGIALESNITSATGNLIIGNSIFNNAVQGIDLENDGIVLDNDGLMDESEQNAGIDYPNLIKSENCDFIETVTTYELSVPIGYEYRMEFFTVTTPDEFNGEGETLLAIATVSVTTNPQTFTYEHGEIIPPGTVITATVSQIDTRNTSEFGTNVITQNISGDPSISYDNICPNGVAVPNFDGDIDGTFRFLEPVPVDGEAIDELTGEITGALEGVTYQVIYGFPVCTNEDTASFSVTLVEEEFTFENFCVVGEEAGSLPIPVNPDVSYFLLLGADDGATIDNLSGLISNPVEGTAYTVVDSAFNAGCWQADTILVTAVLVDEAFSFDNICYGETGMPYDVATDGGAFSFNPEPGDGALLSDVGELTEGQPYASYTIKHLVSNEGCTDSMEVVVEITTVNTNFTFDDFCPADASPAPIVEVEGGTFLFETSPLYDETIDPISGVISSPTEGESYQIIYTDTLDACFDSDTVEVIAILVDQSFTHSDFCWAFDSDEAIPAVGGGTFSFGTPLPFDDAILNPDNGVLSGASEGATYEIVYTLTVDACTQADSLFIEAIGIDESFVFDDYCPSEFSPAPIPATDGGEFTFPILPGDGATINALTGVISNGIEGTSYSVMYTVIDETGECSESSTEIVEVIAVDESFVFNNFCAEFSGYPTEIATEGGVFALVPPIDGDAEIDPLTGILINANPGAFYQVEYTVGTCAERDTILVLAKASETADFNLDDFCANVESLPEITGTTGGLFDLFPAPADGTTIDEETGLILTEFGGDYSVRYITAGTEATCSDTIVQLVTVFPEPKIISIFSDLAVYCPETIIQAISITEEEAINKAYWYNDYPDGEPLDSMLTYLPDTLLLGDNTFYILPTSADGCIGELETYSLFLSDTAGMQAGLDQEICLGSPSMLSAYGGSSYNWITEVPLSDNTQAIQQTFSLIEQAYIVEITNAENCVVYDTLHVDFLPESECKIEVFNAFSPNEDGKNDFWYIDNLINFIPNTVYIYNSWGNEIRAIENYDNIGVYWDGTDASGNQLHAGTYYYVVITKQENLNQAGWVQIVR